MTITLDMWEKEYLADGVSVGPYGIPFPFLDANDLNFYVITAAGAVNMRTGVTVTRFGDGSGGTWTFTGAAPVAGARVRVERDLRREQLLDLLPDASFQPDNVERQLDRQVMILQRIVGLFRRVVGLPDVLALRGANLPVPQGNFLLGWNEDGTGFKNFDPSQFSGGGGGGVGVSDHGALTGLGDDDHAQYHTFERFLAAAVLLSAEAPTNAADIAANPDADPPIDPLYRRPWANTEHLHGIDDVTGLAPKLQGNVKDLYGSASFLTLQTPLTKVGAHTLAAGVLTLDLSTGSYFRVTLTEDVTSIVLTYGTLDPVPANGLVQEFTLYVQQPATGDSDRTLTFPETWKFPNDTPEQPATGASIGSRYQGEFITGGTDVFVTYFAGYAAEQAEGEVPWDDSKPYAAQYYGNWQHLTRIGNVNSHAKQLAAGSVFAYKAGTVTKVSYHNRLDSTRVRTGGLGYGSGDCKAHIEVRKLNSVGLPDMSTSGLLGRTAQFVPRNDFPLNTGSGAHPDIPLQSGFTVPAGGMMCCVVFVTDETSREGNDYWDLVWSLNCNIVQKKYSNVKRRGEFWGDLKAWTSSDGGSTWKEHKTSYTAEAFRGTHAWSGELVYSDDKAVGLAHWLSELKTTSYKLIDGANSQIRQSFRMPATQSFKTKSFWINLAARSSAPVVSAVLRNFGGTVQAVARIPADKITKFSNSYTVGQIYHGSEDGKPNADTAASVDWYEIPLPVAVTLAAGTRYDMTFRAGQLYTWNGSAWVDSGDGAGIAIKGWVADTASLPSSGNTLLDAYFVGGAGSLVYHNGCRNGVRGNEYGSQDTFGANADTKAQFTTNGGTSWSDLDLDNSSAPNNDWPLAFKATV